MAYPRLIRWFIGLSLLAFQVGAIVTARFVPARYFCWAPFDMQTDYRIEATIDGRRLTAAEIQQRYRRPAKGTDNRSTQHLIDLIEGAERRYHASDVSDVTLTYRVNGKQEQVWHYRQP